MVFQHWRTWLATRGLLPRLLLPAPEQTPPLTEELEQLLLELEQVQQEAEKYSRLYAEAQGDLARMKGRLEQAREKYTRQGQQALLQELLPVFDGLWRAFQERPHDLAGHQWVKGVDLVARQLTVSLRKLGVLYAFGEAGQPFHPQWHEAVAVEIRADLQEGTIVRVHQQGYVLGESLMRPARVTVSALRKPAQLSSSPAT